MTTHHHRWRGWPLLVLALCAPVGAGCAGGIPRIDPTGRGLFVVDPPPGSSSLTTIPAPATGAAVPGCAPMATQPIVVPPMVIPAAPALPTIAPPPAVVVTPVTPAAPVVALQLAPTDTIAPVGSEVVLLAGVPTSKQMMHSRHRVEWTVAPSSVGHIASISQPAPCDWLFGSSSSARKIDANYAISTTALRGYLLNRGTQSPLDDTLVSPGQTWASVTSPQEGVSYVSAFAPQLGTFEARQRNSRIYWIDAQWSFPASTAAPAGGRQSLSTSILRLSDRSPLAGYTVRYSIVGGAPATFGAGDSQAAELDTTAAGEANIDIMQSSPAAGTTEVRVEIVRPATLGGFDGRTMTVATGIARVTWAGEGQIVTPAPPPITPPVTTPPATETQPEPAAPSLPQIGMEISTPPAAIVGDPVRFNVTVTNLGTTPTPPLLVRDQYGAGLLHELPDNPLENDIPALQPGQPIQFPIDFTTNAPGNLQHTVTVLLKDARSGQEQVLQSVTGSVLVTDPPADEPPITVPFEPPTTETQPTTPSDSATPVSSDLLVEISGPLTAKTGDEARFSIRVTNRGATDLNDVTVLNHFDPQLTPLQVSGAVGGHQRIGEDIEWLPLATLPAGKSKSYAVVYRCTGPNPAARTSATVTCREQLRVDDQATIAISAGASNLTAQIFESRNPLRVGSTSTYEIRLVNNSQSADANVAVTVTLPRELTFVPVGSIGPGDSAPRVSGNQVQFPQLAELRPAEPVSFRVAARGVQAGAARVTAEITSAGLARPLLAEKVTEVISE